MRSSIFWKLLCAQMTLLCGVVVALAWYFPSRQVSQLEASLEAKAKAYAKLTAEQVRTAVAFDDLETPRELFEALALDPEVSTVAVWYEGGKLLYARGVVSAEARATATRVGLKRYPAHLLVVEPVVSLEGPTGTLTLELSTAAAAEARRAVAVRASVIGGLVLLIGALGAWIFAGSLARRIEHIELVVSQATAGDLAQPPISDASRDELGRLGQGINAMLGQLRESFETIRRTAATENQRLEQLVQERTAALDARSSEMRLLLDSVDQGFLTVSPGGFMSTERSRILVEWFGEPPASGSFFEYVRAVDAERGDWLEPAWSALGDGVFPLEVALDQLPKRLEVGARHLELDYKALDQDGDRFSSIFVVLSDVTTKLKQEEADGAQRDLMAVFASAISDRAGFSEFLSSAEILVAAIVAADANVERSLLLRQVHTLKGNAAVFGAHSISRLCHELEDELDELSSGQRPTSLLNLQKRWAELSSSLRPILTGRAAGHLELSKFEYDSICKEIEGGTSHARLLAMVRSWRLEPVGPRLERIAVQARLIADRLGKSDLLVHTVSNGVRVSASQWANFWPVVIHAVRNAIDHGIEPADQRVALGKPAFGCLELRTERRDSVLRFEIEDDGRGIDWVSVEQRARRAGLPADSERDLVDALFHDGLTTRPDVSDTSGRGAGMGAIQQACEAMGGWVEVHSTPGQGTRVICVWPVSASMLLAAARTGESRGELQIEP